MAQQGGLTRRRGAGGGATINTDVDSGPSSRVTSPGPKPSSYDNHNPETSYASGENGHMIAFDPRDISESVERSKQPKLTLMEEILLLGLKDKQVRPEEEPTLFTSFSLPSAGLSIILERQYLICFTRMHCD